MRESKAGPPRLLGFVIVLVLTPLGLGRAALADTFVVNSSGSQADDLPGDGICHTAAGTCTLQAAIQEGNALGGATIHFNVNDAGCTSPFQHCTITNGGLIPPIAKPMTIDGYSQPGAVPNSAAPFQPTNAVIQIIVPGLAVVAGGGGTVIQGMQVGITIDHADGCIVAGNIGGVSVRAASSNRIGGTSPADRNLIPFGPNGGINFFAGGTANVIQGNFIGTLSDGTYNPAISFSFGIGVAEATATVIGGTTPGAGNLISGGGQAGIYFNAANGASVQGNRIGTDRSGLPPSANSAAIVMASGGPFNIVIGGVSAGEGNIVANTDHGIQVNQGSSISVRGNSIHDNGNSGLVVSPGANNNQAAPVLTTATVGPTGTIIGGMLHMAPNTSYGIDLYTNPSCDPSGFGEGETYLGPVGLTTNASGDGSFSILIPPLPQGTAITATAVDSFGNTSQFSACLVVSPSFFSLIPDGRAVTLPLAAGSNHYQTKLAAGHSYAVEAEAPASGAGTISGGGPALAIGVSRSDGSPLSNAPADRAACAPAGSARLTLLPVSADVTAPLSIQVSDPTSSGYPVRTRIVETTMYCPRWSIDQYTALIDIANTSSCVVSGVVQLLSTGGFGSAAGSFSFSLQPGAATQIPIQSQVMSGTAYIAHDGAAGALTAGIYTVQPGSPAAANFRWPFEEVRAYGSTDGK